MSQAVDRWFPPFSNGNNALARRSLRRNQRDWVSALSFTFGDPSKTYNLDVVPVIPHVAVGGYAELLPLSLEDIGVDFEEGQVDPEVVSLRLTQEQEAAASKKPWNQNLLDLNNSRSLYRVIKTHVFKHNSSVLPRGLFNTRNMCFFNSVLQVLIHCAPFNSLLDDISHSVPLTNNGSSIPVLNALAHFFYSYSNLGGEQKKAISVGTLYDVICDHPKFHIERDRQEDSQEFLGDLLDVLETDFRQAPPTEEDKRDNLERERSQDLADAVANEGWTEIGHKSKVVETQHAGYQDLDNPVQVLFGGRFKSVLNKQGGKPSVTYEPFQQVPVDISSPEVFSVQRAFREVLAEEHLVLGSTPATKRLELDVLPPILIVHLKRFTFIRHGDSFEFGKIAKPIMIEDTLALNCNGRGIVNYTPIGVIYHHGWSATRGHYTADVKVQHQWYSIDDEQVIPVKQTDVLGQDDANGGGSRSAYMIFYERRREKNFN